MKLVGSLHQFIQPIKNPQQTKKLIYFDQLQKTANEQTKKKYDQIQRQRRVKTTLDNYVASNKKLIMKTQHMQNDKQKEKQSFSLAEEVRMISERYRQGKYKKPVHAILLPKRSEIVQLQARNKYHIDQGLLRALEKIKINQSKEKISQKKYQSSFLSYSETLSKLKLVPMQDSSQRSHRFETSNRLSIKVKKQRSKTELSNTKRIQFERCLSWAKKHNKDGSFYKSQLSKQKIVSNWPSQVKRRKNLLSVLGQKYIPHLERSRTSLAKHNQHNH